MEGTPADIGLCVVMCGDVCTHVRVCVCMCGVCALLVCVSPSWGAVRKGCEKFAANVIHERERRPRNNKEVFVHYV